MMKIEELTYKIEKLENERFLLIFLCVLLGFFHLFHMFFMNIKPIPALPEPPAPYMTWVGGE